MHGNPSSGEHAETIETVRSLPCAMRNMGWTTSAELMERWLRSPAWVLPPDMKAHDNDHSYTPENTDQRLVRMAWAMEHPRFRAALDELRRNMTNQAARELWRKRFTRLKWGSTNQFIFGGLQANAVELERSCYSNRVPFGGKVDILDDMQGSLGVGTLKVALIGKATREPGTGKIALQTSHAGFYIRDTYDFNGFQYLGSWAKDRMLSGGQTALNFPRRDLAHRGSPVKTTHVFNRDFDNYRRATGFGGDFVVYSDVLWERANLKLEFRA
jgi:hypothetical protein